MDSVHDLLRVRTVVGGRLFFEVAQFGQAVSPSDDGERATDSMRQRLDRECDLVGPRSCVPFVDRLAESGQIGENRVAVGEPDPSEQGLDVVHESMPVRARTSSARLSGSKGLTITPSTPSASSARRSCGWALAVRNTTGTVSPFVV